MLYCNEILHYYTFPCTEYDPLVAYEPVTLGDIKRSIANLFSKK